MTKSTSTLLGFEEAGTNGLQRQHRAGDQGRLLLEDQSSTEVPKPSFRISTPNSLAEAAAPYSLAAAMVMSKGRHWSPYQGRAGSLKPWTVDSGMLSRSSEVAFTGRGTSRVIEELKAPVWSVVRLSETWNWGRIFLGARRLL